MSPYQGHERRSNRSDDRRQSERSGKFDRRKNRCVTCHFYKPQSDMAGVCQKHQTMIRAQDFACVWYLPIQPPPEQPSTL